MKVRLEVRKHQDAEDGIDEVLLYDEEGHCFFHLETLGDEHAWFAVYNDDPKNRVEKMDAMKAGEGPVDAGEHFHIVLNKGRIVIQGHDDEGR